MILEERIVCALCEDAHHHTHFSLIVYGEMNCFIRVSARTYTHTIEYIFKEHELFVYFKCKTISIM